MTVFACVLCISQACAPPDDAGPNDDDGGTTLRRIELSEVRFWAYQITRLENDRGISVIDALVESRYDLLVLEPTRSDRENTAFDTAGMVRRLHESAGS